MAFITQGVENKNINFLAESLHSGLLLPCLLLKSVQKLNRIPDSLLLTSTRKGEKTYFVFFYSK